MYYSSTNSYAYDELYHHGILGQKWGVRRFQNKSGGLTAAGKKRYAQSAEDRYREKADKHIEKTKTSKTRLGKYYHNNMARYNEEQSFVARNRSRDKGNTLKMLSNEYGSGRKAAEYEAERNYRLRKRDYQKSEKAKIREDSKAYNADQMRKKYTEIHNANNAKEKFSIALDAIGNTKLKTLSGEDTTSGKVLADKLISDIGWQVAKKY